LSYRFFLKSLKNEQIIMKFKRTDEYTHKRGKVYTFVVDDDYPAVVTVYFPYTSRYYQGGSRYEDNILK